MNKFILLSFMMLGFGFYEMSGGADFAPEPRPAAQTTVVTAPVVPFDAPQITRAALRALPNVTETPQISEAKVTQASLTTTPVQAAVIADLRQVTGRRVNMRSGPGIDYGVLDTLTFGTQTQVIELTPEGWARVRVTDTNQIGWMSARLLSNS
ncbi:SH3 domain-containing protein [Yoonia sp. MH D7]